MLVKARKRAKHDCVKINAGKEMFISKGVCVCMCAYEYRERKTLYFFFCNEKKKVQPESG